MELKKLLARIPEEEYKKLIELSKKEDRSINSMLVQLINRYKGD